MIEPINHGTYWSAGQLKKLSKRCASGYVNEQIAKEFGRTVTACQEALRVVRKAEMIAHGNDSDTLLTWKKRYEK